MKSVLVYCWLGGRPKMNLGEWFYELILAKLGYRVCYWPQDQVGDEPVLMAIGSGFDKNTVARLLKPSREVWVWGEGNGKEDVPCPPQDERIHVTAFRGPITAAGYGVTDVPLCDPGWLMPWAFPIEREPGSETLYVPHCGSRYAAAGLVKRRLVTNWLDPMVTRKQLPGTLRRIVNARFVLTSTLHTMILCLAYGTPCAYHGTAPLNMPQKWRDVFGAIPPQCKTLQEGWSWWLSNGVRYRYAQNPTALLKVFPHHLASDV
jgi:hypothetical protein